MTHSDTDHRETAISPTPPSTPRLRMGPDGIRHTLLDGGWWPRSTDPVAELPSLVLAIDKLGAPVSQLILAVTGWDSHPRRLGVNGRVVRLGYFASQPTSLLTALRANGDRVDLLVVAPNTAEATADAAMTLAATTTNLVHAQDVLAAVSTDIGADNADEGDDSAEATWDAEGGHPASGPPRARRGQRHLAATR